MDLLDQLLREPLSEVVIPDAAAWKTSRSQVSEPAARAVLGGLHADRPAWAFASGYFAATSRFAPGPTVAALCATEDRPPVHPARVATTFVDGRVRGHKGFVTLGAHADTLLVLASAGRDGEHNHLVLVAVDARAPGVQLTVGPVLSFVPEVDHADVVFEDAPGTALPGDGWTDFVRPFRTIEDVHVHLALLGWLVRLARRSDLHDAIEQSLALIASGVALASRSPDDKVTHRAVAGFIDLVHHQVGAFGWDRVDPASSAAWERDRRLLQVASGARDARRRNARIGPA